VFALADESGDAFGGHASGRPEVKLANLLAQWPISFHFKERSAGQQEQQWPAQQRQCNSLSDNTSQPNRCQTLNLNQTNHVCRCDHFGFVSLTNSQTQVPPMSSLADFHWPQLQEQEQEQRQRQRHQPRGGGQLEGQANELLLLDSLGLAQGAATAPAYINAHQSTQTQTQPQQHQHSQPKQGLPWPSALMLLGLALLLVSLATLLASAILRASANSRAAKKQQGFLAAAGPVLGQQQQQQQCGPPGGPLVDSAEPAPLADQARAAQPNPIIGLTQPACHAYKAHQQLYAAHLSGAPAQSYALAANSRWASWTGWLKPRRWLSAASAGRPVQHRVLGASLAGAASSAYKSHYQNGYTTSLRQTAGAHLPLNAPSSASSYVSSSAYYEEIGPANLAKVSTGQLANSRTHTVVDPFKCQPPAADQQQLLASPHNQHQHHLQHQLHLQHQWPPAGSLPYALESQHQQECRQSSSYVQPLSSGLANHRQQANDLSQTQSSSSSAASAGLVVAAASASTPRHYLFASPSAVSAYKTSMGNQHRLQDQPAQQQQHPKAQEHLRFMHN